jgi:hypothetical protein
MKPITKIALLALGWILLTGLAGVLPGFRPVTELQVAAQAANRHVFTLDVAADCRTFVNIPERAGVSYGSGKIFPAGTLPTGTAGNDPTQPVNGVAPIGDWTTSGQFTFPFPASVASFYSSMPSFFATQYYLLDGGETALTVQGYAYFQGQTPVTARFAITGGIGRFSGAAGDLKGAASIGTNATGCPNFRATFNFEPGSVRGASN